MNRITKIAAVALMAVASVANAQMSRKEVVLDTGRGGVELKFSVPDFPVAGPVDFSGNPGVAKYNINKNGINVQGQEAAFVANMGPTTTLSFNAIVTKTTSKTDKITQEAIAKELFKNNGQKFEQAQPIETNYPLFKDGKNYTYKLCSQPEFKNKKDEFDCSIIQVAISNDQKQSVGLMTVISEEDTKNLNAQKIEKQTDNAYKYMMMETRATIKQ